MTLDENTKLLIGSLSLTFNMLFYRMRYPEHHLKEIPIIIPKHDMQNLLSVLWHGSTDGEVSKLAEEGYHIIDRFEFNNEHLDELLDVVNRIIDILNREEQ